MYFIDDEKLREALISKKNLVFDADRATTKEEKATWLKSILTKSSIQQFRLDQKMLPKKEKLNELIQIVLHDLNERFEANWRPLILAYENKIIELADQAGLTAYRKRPHIDLNETPVIESAHFVEFSYRSLAFHDIANKDPEPFRARVNFPLSPHPEGKRMLIAMMISEEQFIEIKKEIPKPYLRKYEQMHTHFAETKDKWLAIKEEARLFWETEQTKQGLSWGLLP